MTQRFLINDPDDFVQEALEGLVAADPRIALCEEPLFLYRSTLAKDKVAIVSGGGTGHEPLHAGLLGQGMLDAAVPGAIFASPTAVQVAAATAQVSAGKGVLHIVKNYTGDVLNFKIAAEICADDGIEVQHVLVDDDVATDIAGSRVGRRGTAATLVVEKICGAAAEQGKSLSEVAELGRLVANSSRSMALALNACTHPNTQKKSFELASDEVELGVGIHGERGRARVPYGKADDLLVQLVEPIVEALALGSGDRVIAVINGLGSTHPTELYVATRAVHKILKAMGIEVARTLTGSFVTALDMAGLSVTLSKVDDQILELWDAPVRTPALSW
ncbi:dihydroxyacetone kinase subunit DhaK [Jonesiaceae bacterium BS-20]|uniref:Dihydroxyacetone kinase subunit DhaK n=1 Tax=Jonesiaceae bacterium BS-20 TaxID=3120821 RepID=A0AAU7DXW1_9MICO